MIDQAATHAPCVPTDRALGAMHVDIASFDTILVSSSAGKDSQAMLDYVVELARAAGVLDRVVVVHADLGRVEWDGTRELAQTQAEAYGVRFEVVTRIGGVSPGGRGPGAAYGKGDVFGDLLDHARRRGRWPGPGNARYCTSDHKRGPVRRLITQLHREHGSGPFRLLNCLGMRSEESPRRRAFKPLVRGASPSARDTSECCTKNREVWTWLPIHDWTEAEVWKRIRLSGVPYHPAYDLGMSRLSCVFCIFAPKEQLLLAGAHNPELLDAYVEVEEQTGHTFKVDVALADVRAELRRRIEARGPYEVAC